VKNNINQIILTNIVVFLKKKYSLFFFVFRKKKSFVLFFLFQLFFFQQSRKLAEKICKLEISRNCFFTFQKNKKCFSSSKQNKNLSFS